jgi:hypothetical protein
LDAFSTLWKVNTVDGVELYGAEYKSLYYFASIHNDGGGNGACDEFHGDQGFVNNHMMLGVSLLLTRRLHILSLLKVTSCYTFSELCLTAK